MDAPDICRADLLRDLIWCTVYVLTVVPFTMFGNHMAGRSLVHNTHLHEPLLSAWNLFGIYGADLTGFPANGVLWYVRNLLILVVLAPALIKAVANRLAGIAILLMAGAAFFLHDWMPRSCWQFFETGFSLRGLFYFLLGLFLAAHPVKPTTLRPFRSLLPLAWIGASLFFTAVRLQQGEDSLTLQRILAKSINFLGVGAVWVLYDFIPAAKRLLGIILTVMCARCEDILSSRLHVPAIGIFLLRIAVPILLSLMTAELLKRHCPRIYALLTGGR